MPLQTKAESPLNRVRRSFRAMFNRNEISGSLGDLGTFIPLLVGMSITNGLDFTSALFFAGIFNIVTGLIFEIPMAVQPMKAIAAVAISEHLTLGQILSAGIWTSALVLLLGITGLIDTVDRVIPKPVVRGLQLGLGLQLIGKGVQLVRDTKALIGFDSVAIGILAFLLVLAVSRRKIPSALLLFAAGLGLAVAVNPGILGTLRLGMNLPHWSPPAWSDFRSSLFRAAVPQIPLTLLNSVIAVCALSADLFPRRPASPRAVSVSVGLMNLIGCWFGAMPMCHGAGGLAGQYRFGARTSGSIVFLGLSKLFLAFFFGTSLLALLHVYPRSVLGVLLAISGLELALVARDQTERVPVVVMLTTAAAILALESTATGFVIGWATALVLGQGAARNASAADTARQVDA